MTGELKPEIDAFWNTFYKLKSIFEGA